MCNRMKCSELSDIEKYEGSIPFKKILCHLISKSNDLLKSLLSAECQFMVLLDYNSPAIVILCELKR